MASGLSNKLTAQIGEYLACAELGRHGLIATTFTGNVPDYDLLVCDGQLKTIPIQVKTTRGASWPSQAGQWMRIEFDHKAKQQINRGRQSVENSGLVYICIALGKKRSEDRFFICQKRDIQDACIKSYKRYMDPKDWKRPKNYKSLDNRYHVEDLEHFEDNWLLVSRLLSGIE